MEPSNKLEDRFEGRFESRGAPATCPGSSSRLRPGLAFKARLYKARLYKARLFKGLAFKRLARLGQLARSLANAFFATALPNFTAITWYCKKLDASAPDGPTSPLIEYRLVRLSHREHWLWCLHRQFGNGWDAQEMTLARRWNYLMVEGRIGRVPVAYLKVGVHHAYLESLGETITVPPRVALIYDMFIVPELRATGHACQAIAAAGRLLAERRFSYIAWPVADGGHSVLAPCPESGLQPYHRLWTLGLMGGRLFSRDPARLLRQMCDPD